VEPRPKMIMIMMMMMMMMMIIIIIMGHECKRENVLGVSGRREGERRGY
jgi:hypothetical protein